MNRDASGGTIVYTLRADAKPVEQAMTSVERRAQSTASNIENAFSKINFSGLVSEVFNLAKSFETAFSNVGNVASNLTNGITDVFNRLGGVSLPDFSSAFLFQGARDGVDTLSTVEDSLLSMTKLLGSQEKAEAAIARIRKEAAATPFGIGNLSLFTQQLAASTKNADSAIDAIMAFGKAIKISGGSLNEMGALLINMQQGFARGFNTIDMRQFKSRIPILNDILAAAGYTEEQIIASGTKGAAMLVEALQIYGEAIPWETFENNLSQIRDTFEENVTNTFAFAMESSGAYDILKKALKDAAAGFEQAQPALENLFRTLAEVFAEIDWKLVIEGLASALTAFVNGLKTGIPIFMNFVKVLGGGDFGQGIANIFKFVSMWKMMSGVTKQANAIIGTFKSFLPVVTGFSKVSHASISLVGTGIAKTFTGIGTAFSKTKNGLTQVPGMLSKLGTAFTSFGKHSSTASKTISTSSKLLSASSNIANKGIDTLFTSTSKTAESGAKVFSKAMSGVGGSFKTAFKETGVLIDDGIHALGRTTTLQRIGLFFSGLKDKFLSGFNLAWTYIKTGAQNFGKNIANLAKIIGTHISSFASAAKNLIVKMAEPFIKGIKTVANAISNFATSVGRTLLNGLTTLKNTIFKGASVIGNALKTFASTVARLTTTAAKNIANLFNKMWNGISTAISKGLSVLSGAFQSLSSFISKQLISLGNLISSGVQKVIGIAQKAFTTLASKITSIVQKVASVVGPALSWLGNKIGGFLSAMGQHIANVASKMLSMLTTLFQRIGAILGNLVKGIWNAMAPAFEWVGQKIGAGFQRLGSLLSKAANKFLGIAQKALGGVASKIGNVGSKVGQKIGNIFSKDKSAGKLTGAGESATKLGELNQKGNLLQNTQGIKNLAVASLAAVGFAAALFILGNTPFDPLKTTGQIIAMGVIGWEMVKLSQMASKANIDQMGILTLVEIAGVTALLAGALWIVNNVMPSDFLGLQGKILSMALVVVEMGALAAVAGIPALQTVLLPGLLTLVGIAGVLAVLAGAMWLANNLLPGASEFVAMQAKIGGLALVVVEIGALAAVIGAIMMTGIGAALILSGLGTMVVIAAALAGAALGIRTAADNLPDDMKGTKNKIKDAVKFLMELKDEYGEGGGLIGKIGSLIWNENGTQAFTAMIKISNAIGVASEGIKNASENIPENMDPVIGKIRKAIEFLMQLKNEFGEGGGLLQNIGRFFWNQDSTNSFDVITEIAEKLKKLADNLVALNDVSTNKLGRVVDGPLFSTLKSAMTKLKDGFTETGGLMQGIADWWSNDNGTQTLDTATGIAEKLGSLVENLSSIQTVNPKRVEVAIEKVIPALKRVVTKLKSEFTEEGGLWKSIGDFFGNNDSTATLDKAKEIAEKLGGMVENLSKIGNLDVAQLNSITEENGPLVTLRKVVNKIKTEFVDGSDSVASALKDFDTSYLQRASEIATNIKQIADTVSGVGSIQLDIPKIEQFLTNMRTITGKIVAEFTGENALGNFDEQIATSVQNIAGVAKNLSEMSKNINAIEAINIEATTEKLKNMRTVLQTIAALFTEEAKVEGIVYLDISAFNDGTIETSINSISNILTVMSTMAKTANEMQSIDMDALNPKLKNVEDMIRKLKTIILGEGEGEEATGGLIEFLDDIAVIDLGPVITIINNLKTIADTVVSFPDAKTGAEKLSAFTESLAQAIVKISEKLTAGAFNTKLIEIGGNLTQPIMDGFNTKLSQIGTAEVTKWIEKFKTFWPPHQVAMQNIGKDIVKWIVEGFNLEDISPKVDEYIYNRINNTLRDKNYSDIGRYIVEGIANGMSWNVWRINNAVGQISGAAVNTLKSLLGIASPSKVFYEMGSYMGEGLVLGLNDMAEDVARATENLVGRVNTELEELNDLTIDAKVVTGNHDQANKTNNITVNNNINNGLDMSAMLSQLRWDLMRS